MSYPTTPDRTHAQSLSEPDTKKLIASSNSATVVAETVPAVQKSTAYQSEAQLEREFIAQLEKQGYEYATWITDHQAMTSNLRTQLEKINKYQFTDEDWDRFYKSYIANPASGIVEKTKFLQTDPRVQFVDEHGHIKNITVLDKDNIHNNVLQVINQYKTHDKAQGGKNNRYDVTVLVNGLPMVHIELKRRGVALKEAFNQINRYSRDSFWADSGLFEYAQLFVISNGTHTKYYSNTTRFKHVKDTNAVAETASRNPAAKKKTSNSFEFTSWWADVNNTAITDLIPFATTFFSKHTLLSILTRYCVFTVDEMLLVMRPYQIAAAEKILNKIEMATNYKQLGTVQAGGYIWHSTGSGKTLTSFKTAQLATEFSSVDKVLFVVDRKDLDYQTIREYDRFQKGAANSNISTKILTQQLSTTEELLERQAQGENVNLAHAESKIVVTTIQKLSNFVEKNTGLDVFNQHVVFIFDECHRSQFGSMHKAITKKFKKYNMFGFTGTPIFKQNALSSGDPNLKTTKQAFGDCLHTYTVVDAIGDQNVLKFKVEYHNVIPRMVDLETGEVVELDGVENRAAKEAELLDPVRVEEVTRYILEHFDQKTKRVVGSGSKGAAYEHKVVANVAASTRKRNVEKAIHEAKVLRGFNAMFATASIDAAMAYYTEFKAQQADVDHAERLKIATIFSAGGENDNADSTIQDESFDAGQLSVPRLEFLQSAIDDYNEMFSTNYVAKDSESFENYYKDLSQRLKNREVDLVIVVNMFLTGFDATTLNTLFVDKNLRMHGLIQAFSRTNRILNSVKTFGNIVCFRDLDQATNEALELFGNADNARQVAILAPFSDFYEEYAEKVSQLKSTFTAGELIISESGKVEFVKLFSEILRLENILTTFDEFEEQKLLSDRENQDYKSMYLDIYQEFKDAREAEEGEDEDAGSEEDTELDDAQLVFELELVKQVEINVDYILLLIDHLRESEAQGDDKAVSDARENIKKQVEASPTLRPRKDLIFEFMDLVGVDDLVLGENSEPTGDKWVKFIDAKRSEELGSLIGRLKLQDAAAREFVAAALQDDGVVATTGTEITKVLPRTSRFGAKAQHSTVKQNVAEELQAFVDRFYGL